MRRPFLVLLLLTTSAVASADPPAPPKLQLQLVKEGWGDAPWPNAEAVFRSAADQLLPHFPGVTIEPITVQPQGGPITLFQRSKDGRIVVKLSTRGTLWAQYAFQFAHELGHVLCGYEELQTGHLWLEESLCELSSLYTLRSMAEAWKTKPPYSNWKDYAKHLHAYAQKRIDEHPLPAGKTLAEWYRDNAEALTANATDRERNTVVAAALLPLFEKEPAHWAAVHYLNVKKPKARQTLPERLQNWHDQTPAEHRGFVRAIAKEFGVELK
jgi:hypothetical protein